MTNDDIRKQVEWLRGELKRREDGVPSPSTDDLRYSLPATIPTVTENGIAAYLDSRNLWQGLHYRLTNGQRGWLRQRYDMTPAQTVTVESLVLWEGTQHPREITLRSDEHVPNNRKHVLSCVIIHDVGTFLRESAERDAEGRGDGVSALARGGNASRVRKDGEFSGFVAELEEFLASSEITRK